MFVGESSWRWSWKSRWRQDTKGLVTCAKGTNFIPFWTKENTGKITQVVASPDFTSLSWSAAAAAAAAKSLQPCPTLCDPIDGSPPGSPVPGILQARTLEWVAISFSNAWKWKVKVKLLSCVWLLATPWTAAYQAPPSMGFARQEYWSGSPVPSPLTWSAAKSLQSCPTLCNAIDGSPPGSPVPGILQARTLEWVAISFSNAWKWKVKVKSLSRVRLFPILWTEAYQAPPSMGFSRQEYWSGVPLPYMVYMLANTENVSHLT